MQNFEITMQEQIKPYPAPAVKRRDTKNRIFLGNVHVFRFPKTLLSGFFSYCLIFGSLSPASESYFA